MSIIELGALGEFLGSIGVIATLIYLAIQIRQNTHSLDEGRKLAAAQAYQARADMTQEAIIKAADSPYSAQIFLKLGTDSTTGVALPEGLERLTAEEQWRLYRYSLANFIRNDNTHYQYQQGFIDREYYESVLQGLIRMHAPMWKELGLFRNARPSFREEVERIVSESETESEENEQ